MGPPAAEEANAAPPRERATSPAPSPEADAGGEQDAKECPNCGAPGLADALFCEACGYDYTTGTMPRAANALDLDAPIPEATVSRPIDHSPTSAETPASGTAAVQETAAEAEAGAEAPGAAVTSPNDRSPSPVEQAPVVPVSAAATRSPQSANPSLDLSEPWLAEVWIDPAWYRDQGSPDPMPSPGPPELIVLRKSSLLVGRESTSRGIVPDIDCGIDNGVSRRHAQLTTDGTRWWVEDLDSANGVWIGDVVGELPRKPIPARSKREFNSDDRLYVGSWTRIVVRRATQDEIDALA
jgi:hypothetical protein